jgi:hypothetical protein
VALFGLQNGTLGILFGGHAYDVPRAPHLSAVVQKPCSRGSTGCAIRQRFARAPAGGRLFENLLRRSDNIAQAMTVGRYSVTILAWQYRVANPKRHTFGSQG